MNPALTGAAGLRVCLRSTVAAVYARQPKRDANRQAWSDKNAPRLFHIRRRPRRARNGDRSHCLSATWNDDKKLDDEKFESAYGLLLGALVIG